MSESFRILLPVTLKPCEKKAVTPPLEERASYRDTWLMASRAQRWNAMEGANDGGQRGEATDAVLIDDRGAL